MSEQMPPNGPQQPGQPQGQPPQGQPPQGQPPQGGGSLIDHDVLIMQQTTNFNSNDFDILASSGEPVGRVMTEGSGLGRFFMGSRRLTVAEPDGRPLAVVEDPVNFGFDKYVVNDPQGRVIANIRKQFAMISKKLAVEIADGPALEMRGRLLDYDITFAMDEQIVAEASREWGGVARGFLGHSRYVLRFTVPTPPNAKLAIIGSMIALDLIREKDRRN